LLIRLLAALPQQQPNYMDAAYSYVNALNLAAGRGFVEDFVWNYLDNPPLPPHPSHLYWMPLTSILAWVGMLIGGVSYRAAQMPFVALSALLAPISYWTVREISAQRWQGWLAGLLAIFSGFYFPFWTAIDNFTPFAVAGSLALLFAWRGMSAGKNGQITGNGRTEVAEAGQRTTDDGLKSMLYLLLAGVFVGLAHLARADGFLLLFAVILFLFVRSTRQSPRITFYALRLSVFLLVGYLLVMSPWLIRNWQATGRLLAAAGSQTIWLSSYDELFSYGRELSPRTFLAQGFGPIVQGRWWALVANSQTVLAVWCLIFLAPLVVVGGWRLRHHPLIQLAGLYAFLLFLVMTLVFAFPGARGGLFHSGTALLPFIYATAVVGLDVAVAWAAARRRHWDAKLARQFFGVSLVVMAVLLSGFIYFNRVIKNDAWNSADKAYATVAAWMAQEEPAATVMINNPPAYRYHGGGLSVVVPNEDVEAILQVARRYQVDFLILDPNHPLPLAGVYDQPASHPQLSLVKTFGNVYVFEIIQP
jgi:4-amino-4-deoxy-L-arabinose transferase-like glycosyltransferase